MTLKVKPGAAAAAHGLRGRDLAATQIYPVTTPLYPVTTPQDIGVQVSVIVAEIDGDDRCMAEDITAVARAPVLGICRKLNEAGHDPATGLAAWRGRILALRVRSIAEGARRTVDESHSAFARWKALPRAAVSPGIARFERVATPLAGAFRYDRRPRAASEPRRRDQPQHRVSFTLMAAALLALLDLILLFAASVRGRHAAHY